MPPNFPASLSSLWRSLPTFSCCPHFRALTCAFLNHPTTHSKPLVSAWDHYIYYYPNFRFIQPHQFHVHEAPTLLCGQHGQMVQPGWCPVWHVQDKSWGDKIVAHLHCSDKCTRAFTQKWVALFGGFPQDDLWLQGAVHVLPWRKFRKQLNSLRRF